MQRGLVKAHRDTHPPPGIEHDLERAGRLRSALTESLRAGSDLNESGSTAKLRLQTPTPPPQPDRRNTLTLRERLQRQTRPLERAESFKRHLCRPAT